MYVWIKNVQEVLACDIINVIGFAARRQRIGGYYEGNCIRG